MLSRQTSMLVTSFSSIFNPLKNKIPRISPKEKHPRWDAHPLLHIHSFSCTAHKSQIGSAPSSSIIKTSNPLNSVPHFRHFMIIPSFYLNIRHKEGLSFFLPKTI